MELNIVIDILHTAVFVFLILQLNKQKKINSSFVDRINLCARNPLKARKTRPLSHEK